MTVLPAGASAERAPVPWGRPQEQRHGGPAGLLPGPRQHPPQLISSTHP